MLWCKYGDAFIIGNCAAIILAAMTDELKGCKHFRVSAASVICQLFGACRVKTSQSLICCNINEMAELCEMHSGSSNGTRPSQAHWDGVRLSRIQSLQTRLGCERSGGRTCDRRLGWGSDRVSRMAHGTFWAAVLADGTVWQARRGQCRALTRLQYMQKDRRAENTGLYELTLWD